LRPGQRKAVCVWSRVGVAFNYEIGITMSCDHACEGVHPALHSYVQRGLIRHKKSVRQRRSESISTRLNVCDTGEARLQSRKIAASSFYLLLISLRPLKCFYFRTCGRILRLQVV